MKKIIIFNEHHGKRVFDVSTERQLHQVALSVIKGRFGQQNDYYILEEPTPPEEPDFSVDYYEQMPPGRLKDEAGWILRAYERNVSVYRQEKYQFDTIKRCIQEEDGYLAWKILSDRKVYDDEGFEILNVEESY